MSTKGSLIRQNSQPCPSVAVYGLHTYSMVQGGFAGHIWDLEYDMVALKA